MPLLPGMRRRDCLSLLASTALCARTATAAPTQVALDDHMPAFWQEYDASRSGELDARAAHLVSNFFDPSAASYIRAGMHPTLPGVTRWLPMFDAIANDVRTLHQSFAGGYAANVARFQHALPDFDGHASPVYLVPSLFAFDAHLEPDGARLPLFFGPDGIVRLHGRDADLGVLFSHELFHCYQAQKSPAMNLDPQPPIFASVWIEGTATYASERLNQDATLLHVLLDDATLTQTNAGTLRAAAGAMLECLDVTDAASQAEFFQLGKMSSFPPRMGYYLGLLTARSVGTSMSLPQMAALPSEEVRELVAGALRRIAAAPAAV